MRFSKWHAHGNVYLLTDEVGLTPERVRDEVGDADGIVEVVSAEADEAEVVIWNPDGSTAELSGNGTRIAARWLADRTGAEGSPHPRGAPRDRGASQERRRGAGAGRGDGCRARADRRARASSSSTSATRTRS